MLAEKMHHVSGINKNQFVPDTENKDHIFDTKEKDPTHGAEKEQTIPGTERKQIVLSAEKKYLVLNTLCRSRPSPPPRRRSLFLMDRRDGSSWALRIIISS